MSKGVWSYFECQEVGSSLDRCAERETAGEYRFDVAYEIVRGLC